mgnify:CR=1 FL=1
MNKTADMYNLKEIPRMLNFIMCFTSLAPTVRTDGTSSALDTGEVSGKVPGVVTKKLLISNDQHIRS